MPAFCAHSQIPMLNGSHRGQLGVSPFQGAGKRGLHSTVLNMDQGLISQGIYFQGQVLGLSFKTQVLPL